MHTSLATITHLVMCHNRNFSLTARPGPKTSKERKGDVVKPRQNLPRICQGRPSPEERTKKILIDGALSQVRKSTPAEPPSWHSHELNRLHATSCDFSATPGAPERPARCACEECPRGCSAHVEVCNKYSGEASVFSLPGALPSISACSYRPAAVPPLRCRLPTSCALRQGRTLGRDLDSVNILALKWHSKPPFPIEFSSFLRYSCKENFEQSGRSTSPPRCPAVC